jgi:hypothetical protein
MSRLARVSGAPARNPGHSTHQAVWPVTDQDVVPDSSGRPAPVVSPCRPRPARSLRASAVAVLVTGVVSVAVPFGLLMGKDGLVAASLNSQAPIPTPRVVSCSSGQPIPEPELHPLACVRFLGSGFGPDELIQISETHRPRWKALVRADSTGHFSYRHVLGAADGVDVFSFVGLNVAGPAAVPRVAFCRLPVTGSADPATGA